MPHQKRRFFVAGVLIIACAAGLQAAVPSDLARYTPADTALYVGWSRWTTQRTEQLELTRKLVESLGAEEQQAVLSSLILDLLLPLAQAPAGISLLNVELEEGQPRIDAALVAAAGPEPSRYPQAIERFIAEYGEPQRIQPVTIAGVQLRSCPVADTRLQLIWGLHKDCLILALSQPAAAALIETMNGSAPNLADADEVKFDRRKVQADLEGVFTCVYADVPRVLDIIRRIVAEKADGLPAWFNPLVEETGSGSVRSKYLSFEQRDEVPHTRMFAHVTGPVRGLLRLWQQAPLADEDLRVVPENAYWMYARNLDLAGLWQEALRVVGEVAPEAAQQMEAGEAMATGVLGFSIARDLLPKLGDTWVFFDSPQQGGLLLTGTVLVAETRDAAGLNAILQRLVGVLNGLLGESDISVQREQIERNGHQINYVLMAGVPVPIAPAWSFVGQRVVFGLYPQTVATALDQLDAGIAATQPGAGQAAARPTAVKSLLENPEFRAGRAGLPGPAVGMWYEDARTTARVLYPFLLGLQTALVSRAAPEGALLDFRNVPPWPDQRQRIRTYVSTSSMDPDGIMLASIGSGTVSSGVAAGGLTALMLPSLARARALTKRAVSGSNLVGIGAACYTWADDHDGQFPVSLEVLLDEKLITPKMLHSPRDPTEEVSYVYIAGQTTQSNPWNILAYERPFDDEGTMVLFVAAHAQYMPLEEFKQALAETYKRLGREAEMPGESGGSDASADD